MYKTALSMVRAWMQIRRSPSDYARSLGVTVGDRCRFLGMKPGMFGSEPFLIRIGNHVTITSGVRFVTHDGGVWVFRDEHPDIDVFAPIVIGDNVFIGINSIIMPGVNIGSNVVIGAGSIVTRDIPSNSVAVGSPAKVIRTVDDYREKALQKAVFIRSKPQREKREVLLEKFRDKLNEPR